MSSQQLVSVIIPTYNSASYVVEAVSSVLKQTYQHFEVIVVDDGSTDNTAAILEPFRGKIKYIYQTNQGVSVARNRGIGASHGELVAFLDADDLWLPEKIERQVRCLEENPSVGFAHTDVFYLDTETNLRSRRDRPATSREGNCYVQLFLGNRVQISSVMVRRECLEKVGLFDEDIPKPTVQDYDLWLRVARYFEFAYLTDPLTVYRLHANNASKDIQTLRQHELYVLEKSLKADPTLLKQVGRQSVRKRFFDVWCELGHRSFDLDEFREANGYFTHALQFRIEPYTLILWLASFFPGELVRQARYVKQHLRLSY